ncbi:contact-dependent growth inhibition system immunity protein, partial [Neisseria lactamica]
RYEDWVAKLCGNLGYKTRRALFKNMMSVDIWLHNGRLKISPSRHVKPEAWDAIDADDVILSLDNSPEEIGAGLKLALSRCR